MSVGVVLLDLNQSETTLRCLESLVDGDVWPETVVLVENGDSHISEEKLQTLRQAFNLVVLRPSRNLGCAGGRNLGLNYLATNTDIPKFTILDNDTVVPEGFIKSVETLTFADREVIAPVIKELNGDQIWSSGGAVESDGTIEQFTDPPEGKQSPYTVDWSPGACLIMSRDTWETVGEFDNWMNFLFEDIEWCLRVATAGGNVVVHPNLEIEHEPHQTLGGKISPARTRYWSRNGTVFRINTIGTGLNDSLGWIFTQLKTGLYELVTGRFQFSKARFRGLVEGISESVSRL